MSLPVIADVMRVTYNWNNNNVGRAHNVLHFKTSGGITPADLLTLLDTHQGSGMWDWVSSASAIDTVSFLPLDGSSATTELSSPGGTSWAGHSGSSDTSPQVCGLVKFFTGLRGPSQRGRIFIPHVAETKVLNGVMDDAPGMSTQWNSFITGMQGDGTDLVVASYAHASASNVLTATAENMCSTQKKRLHR